MTSACEGGLRNQLTIVLGMLLPPIAQRHGWDASGRCHLRLSQRLMLIMVYRQQQDERRSLAYLAFRPKSPAVRRDDASRDRQPQTRATLLVALVVRALVEFLEDLFDFFGGNPGAGV
jgi:hypothetical protein